MFCGLGPQYDQTVALGSLGKGFEKLKENEKREAVRRAVGGAVGKVKGVVGESTQVKVDASVDPHAAGKC